MIILPILTTSLYTFLFERMGECALLSLGLKGLKARSLVRFSIFLPGDKHSSSDVTSNRTTSNICEQLCVTFVISIPEESFRHISKVLDVFHHYLYDFGFTLFVTSTKSCV